ncbi:hypothetical protein [Amycolatopsis thailandensis]|uniref:hypothetical protein n=1 Tax=Amycolatopsis thailandensis TaxID=589330 RepID=UPI00362B5521
MSEVLQVDALKQGESRSQLLLGEFVIASIRRPEGFGRVGQADHEIDPLFASQWVIVLEAHFDQAVDITIEPGRQLKTWNHDT